MSDTRTPCCAARKGVSIGTLLGAAALLALVQFASLPAHPKILNVINNFAHGPVFGVLALVLLTWLRPRLASRPWLAYASALLLAAGSGLALETLQIFSRRDASFADVFTNTLGAGSFLCFAAFLDRSIWRRGIRPGGRGLALIAGALQLVILLLPVGHALLAYTVRATRFPTIMQFTSRLDMYFVELRDCEASFFTPPGNSSDAEREPALRIRFLGDDFPGISHLEPSPDWRRFNRLRIDIENPDDRNLVLGLRIHDIGRGLQYEDRFNGEFAIGARTRRVLDVPLAAIEAAPAGRRLDISRIGGLVLFRMSPPNAQDSEVLVTRVWLE